MGDRGAVQEYLALGQFGNEVAEEHRRFHQVGAGGQRNRFRGAGGAAGETQPQRRVEVAIDRARRAAAIGDHVDQLVEQDLDVGFDSVDAVMDDSAAAAVADLVAMRFERLADVKLDAHQSGLEHRVIGDQAVDRIGQQDADAVARLETLGDQRIAQLIGGRVEFAKAERACPFGQARRILVLERGAADD